MDNQRSPLEPGAAAGAPSLGVRKATAFVVCVLASMAFLFSGLPVLIFFALTPYVGMETPLLVAKASIVAGWVVLGVWLAFEVVQLRLRAAIPASLSWAWCAWFWTIVTGFGYIQYGG